MKQLLKKLRLVDYLTTELDIQKEEFFLSLKQMVDEGSPGLLSSGFDVFSPGKNEYRGFVGPDSFTIRRRKRLFDVSMSTAQARGTYHQNGNGLVIETEINSFAGFMIPFFIAILLFYLVFVTFFLSTASDAAFFILPFLVVHAALMFGIPYFIMRRSTSRMKRELEREFYYLTKNQSPGRTGNRFGTTSG